MSARTANLANENPGTSRGSLLAIFGGKSSFDTILLTAKM
jgi:hypothetical protein